MSQSTEKQVDPIAARISSAVHLFADCLYDLLRGFTVNSDLDNPGNLIVQCGRCTHVCFPVRSGIDLQTLVALVQAHSERCKR